MAILEDIWNGFCDFVNYLWCNGDLVAFVILAAISITAAIKHDNTRLFINNSSFLLICCI